MSKPVTILVADNSPLYRQAIAIAARKFSKGVQIREAECAKELDLLFDWPGSADLLVVDLGLQGLDSLETLSELMQRCDCPVALTVDYCSSQRVEMARAVGARGLLPKTLPEAQFGAALKRLLAGLSWYPEPESNRQTNIEQQYEKALRYLSDSELKVIRRVRDGWPNKQIADQLNLAECTIKTHLTNTYRKLEIENRTQLAALAMHWNELN